MGSPHPKFGSQEVSIGTLELRNVGAAASSGQPSEGSGTGCPQGFRWGIQPPHVSHFQSSGIKHLNRGTVRVRHVFSELTTHELDH